MHQGRRALGTGSGCQGKGCRGSFSVQARRTLLYALFRQPFQEQGVRRGSCRGRQSFRTLEEEPVQSGSPARGRTPGYRPRGSVHRQGRQYEIRIPFPSQRQRGGSSGTAHRRYEGPRKEGCHGKRLHDSRICTGRDVFQPGFFRGDAGPVRGQG